MTVIIDYGIGNVFNVQNALEKIVSDVQLTDNPELILSASHIILPGVGAFRDAIHALKERDLIPVLDEAVSKGIPILGICLGMQLLFEKSFENGVYEGLGYLKGSVVKFDERQVTRIPQMGWNTLISQGDSIFESLKEDVYFVHSYYAQTDDATCLSYVDYQGIKVPAIVGAGNVYGMQFHPEKSATVGERCLKAFLTLT